MSIYLPKASTGSLRNASRSLVAGSSRQYRGYATGVKTQEVPEAVPMHKKVADSVLTWPEYLNVRRSRHRWQAISTFPGGIAGLAGGIAYFGSLQTDPMKLIFGFDPFLVYGFLTAGCLGFGALLGPTVGGALWRFTHRHQAHLIDEKDRVFLQHIAKNRVDASLQSATSPVPDYYGERVGSLGEYRQWLRDQSKYRKKVLLPENEE
ncbi:presequence translocated-associated motor subunit PAM17 [Coprinellus micaceus]|uniref:Presequence translocated-associated motor subunit PAM17 n=1 Tax=Coprinellus micaceus TaxID=71717 RepID=A0A4Y7TZK9_COPMI|nr:presequence translocated-associated motor subunit PAM17 [Coprinellus micaceus]